MIIVRCRYTSNMADKELTDMQEIFCQEYLKDLNGTQAAVRAGYAENSANEQASRLLANANISERVQMLMQSRAKRIEIDSDMILKELLLLAKTDLSNAYDENGNLKNVQDMPEEVRRAISGIKVFEEFEGFGKDRVKIGEVRELKFWDKPRALELLGKHLKLFTEVVKIEGKIEQSVTITRIDIDERIKQIKEIPE